MATDLWLSLLGGKFDDESRERKPVRAYPFLFCFLNCKVFQFFLNGSLGVHAYRAIIELLLDIKNLLLLWIRHILYHNADKHL